MWILIIWIVFATAYYTNVLSTLPSQVTVVNTKFFVYVPIEYRYLFSLLIFLAVILFINKFKWS